MVIYSGMVIFHSYVSLPEGSSYEVISDRKLHQVSW
jgi:hypothetical protein